MTVSGELCCVALPGVIVHICKCTQHVGGDVFGVGAGVHYSKCILNVHSIQCMGSQGGARTSHNNPWFSLRHVSGMFI